VLPFDVAELLHNTLRGDRRPPDGKLHPSGDLIGSLRHAQLRAAGAPTIESEIVSDTRLMTGTQWHSYFESIFRQNKLAVMCEVKLDPWLPTGWSGTADWIMWSDEYKAFILGDLKTTKGEGIKFVQYEGMKQEHLWQLSAYWYALEKMGLPLVKGFAVFYLPMNVPSDNPSVQPLVLEGMPLDRKLVLGTMEFRWAETKAYLDSTPQQAGASRGPVEHYLTDKLAPEQERVQVLRWNKGQGVFDVKLQPHWSAAYCPFPDELCACNTTGITKIGHYEHVVTSNNVDEVHYEPRKGFEDFEFDPTVDAPTLKQFEKKEQSGSTK